MNILNLEHFSLNRVLFRLNQMTKYRLDKGKKIEGESIVRMKLLEIYGELFK